MTNEKRSIPSPYPVSLSIAATDRVLEGASNTGKKKNHVFRDLISGAADELVERYVNAGHQPRRPGASRFYLETSQAQEAIAAAEELQVPVRVLVDVLVCAAPRV